MFNPILNHVQAALARLLSQYQDAQNIKNLITSLVNPIQDIESALGDMNTLRYLPNAFGAQLDLIGKIVGLTRPPGLSDASYILDLYGQIKINSSQGQPEQAIQTYQLFTQAPQVRLFELYPAEVLVESQYNPPDQATVNMLIQILDEVLPAGVRANGIVVYDSTAPFSYAGVLQPSGPYGSTGTPGIGGKYGTIKRPFAPFGYGKNNLSIKGYGTVLDPLVGGAYAS